MTPSLDALHEQFNQLFAPMDSAPNQPAPQETPPQKTADAAPAEPEQACKKVDFAKHGYHLDLTVTPDRLLEAVGELDKQGFSIDYITGLDWPKDGQMEVVYDFFHAAGTMRVAVRTRVPRDNPQVPSITSLFAGANWHERETHEFYGIDFTGHPNLIHLLLPDDMDGYPLRKDYKANATG